MNSSVDAGFSSLKLTSPVKSNKNMKGKTGSSTSFPSWSWVQT